MGLRSQAHALFQQQPLCKFFMGLVDSGRRHLPFLLDSRKSGFCGKDMCVKIPGLCSGTLSPGDTQKRFQRHARVFGMLLGTLEHPHLQTLYQIPASHILSQTDTDRNFKIISYSAIDWYPVIHEGSRQFRSSQAF